MPDAYGRGRSVPATREKHLIRSLSRNALLLVIPRFDISLPRLQSHIPPDSRFFSNPLFCKFKFISASVSGPPNPHLLYLDGPF